MNFTALQTRVAEETGLDLENSDDATSIKAWINQTYLHISGIQNWDWLYKQGTFVTTPDFTTGTASVDAFGSTVTFTTAPTALGSVISVAGQYMINFPDVSADWYFFSAHTAGALTATLLTQFNSADALVAGSFIVRRVYYSLPSDVDRIVSIRQQVSSNRLVYVDPRTFDSEIPNPTATGTPRFYSLMGRFEASASAKLWQISLYPVPSERINMQVAYYKDVTEMVLGTDVPLMPAKFHDLLVYGALYFYGHSFIDDDRLASAKARYKETLDDMRANSKHVPDALTRLRPSDIGSNYGFRRYRLPDEYGV